MKKKPTVLELAISIAEGMNHSYYLLFEDRSEGVKDNWKRCAPDAPYKHELRSAAKAVLDRFFADGGEESP